MRDQRGFTLIELLIVIAIIAVLAAAVFVALNPTKRFAESRNAKRWSDVENILTAIKVDQVDNGGTYYANSGAGLLDLAADASSQIGTDSSGCNNCGAVAGEGAGCLSMNPLVTEGYLASAPLEPANAASSYAGGTTGKTGYYLTKNEPEGTITVGACNPEQSVVINVSR